MQLRASFSVMVLPRLPHLTHRIFSLLWVSLGPLSYLLEHQHPDLFAHLSPSRASLPQGSMSTLLMLAGTMLGRSNVPSDC